VFTASAEANNPALQGTLAQSERGGGSWSRRSHPSVLETARALAAPGSPESSTGAELTVLPVGREGVLDPATVERALGPDVALVSVMMANNEIGTLQPIAEIARLAHAAGARMHCDAVQAVGKIPVDVAALGVDLLSLAGHKFLGPLGAAALYVRRRTRLAPLVHGGHQERSRRAGTENLPAIVGLGIACERAARLLASHAPRRLEALGDRLLAGLTASVPDTHLHGDRGRRLPGLVNVRFDGVDGEAVLHELDLEGITVSTGSACSAATPGPSHVLIALGLRPEDAHASVRFSLGEGNDESDVERIITITSGVVARLRTLHAGTPRAEARVAGAGG
jgi:cysteine desulfurase